MTTYYFTTFDFRLAYEVLDIQPNHVYKTDEKGIYHLLKSIIGDPDRFIEYFDKEHSIYLEIDTDLKKIVEIAKENMLSTGFAEPEDFQIPKTKPKVEEPEMLTKFYNDGKPISLARHNGSKILADHYEEKK
jgi:hypothetical protein